MPRTTATLVKEIMTNLRVPRGKTLDQYVDPFIKVANPLVTKACEDADYSAEYEAEIERWLTAHFVCIDQPEVEAERVDILYTKNFGKVDLGFHQTRYGQQALRLDYEGGLAQIDAAASSGGRKTGSVTYLGTTYEEAE